MSGESWIVASLGADRVQKTTDEAELRRLSSALGTTVPHVANWATYPCPCGGAMATVPGNGHVLA